MKRLYRTTVFVALFAGLLSVSVGGFAADNNQNPFIKKPLRPTYQDRDDSETGYNSSSPAGSPGTKQRIPCERECRDHCNKYAANGSYSGTKKEFGKNKVMFVACSCGALKYRFDLDCKFAP